MPKSSQANHNSLLIAAVSGRALAQAARRAGYIPLVADFFADADTEAIAHACRKVPGSIKRGFGWSTLEAALEELAAAAPSPLLGLVYGAGFEDRPELLTRLASRWPLLGNDAATVARLKDPAAFFPALERLEVACPRTTTTLPTSMSGWLCKKRGGAGGSHVGRAILGAQDRYYQQRLNGHAISALFFGDGKSAAMIGFSEQWTAPRRGAAFRYGGAVQPANVAQAQAEKMVRSVARVTHAFGIRGLASADFIVNADGVFLLEINPRPGATLDVFDRDEAPLLRAHVDAVSHRKLPNYAPPEDASAAAIVYAPERLTIPLAMAWPAWAADRPKPGERIDKERPICTVAARAASSVDAKRLVEARTATILAELGGHSGDKENGQEDGRKDAPRRLAEREHNRRAGRAGADR